MTHQRAAAIQTVLQVLRRSRNVTRNGNHAHHRALQVLVLIESAQGLDEEVYPLVFELVASAVDDHQAVAVQRFATQRFGDVKDVLAGGFAFFGKGLVVQGLVNTIDGDDIGFAVEELLALLRRDVAHRREGVGVLGGLLLHRLL